MKIGRKLLWGLLALCLGAPGAAWGQAPQPLRMTRDTYSAY